LITLVEALGGDMLEQWEADHLLHTPKVYSNSLSVDLSPGVDDDYPLESEDGTEFFLLDVWRPRRNLRKARFQLRYRRGIVLARLCTSVTHLNPDDQHVGAPHLHLYREGCEDKWATRVGPHEDLSASLGFFCKQINLPVPVLQGGLT
jgi:hypothetical protein